MMYQGVLTKMQTEFSSPIQYYLVFENSYLNLNQILDKTLEISFEGYQCLECQFSDKVFAMTVSCRVPPLEIGS
jgi:hypothetical protein